RCFACDAWLISCARSARPGREWFMPDYTGPREGTPFIEDGPRVQPLPGIEPGQPQPWLGWIGRRDQPVSWFTDGAAEVLATAARPFIASGEPPLFGRARSLLAVPVVGTVQGGGAERAGEIVQALLPRLEAFAARNFDGRSFDVALLCWDAPSHAA